MDKNTTRKNVVIFSNHLLSYSETFILAQGEGLMRYQANYIGSDLVVGGLCTPPERTRLVKAGVLGKCYDILMKFGYPAPSVIKLFKACSPLLIHAHFGPNGYTATAIAKKIAKPLVITFHGFDLIERPTLQQHGRLHLRYFQNLAELAESGHTLIAVSDFIKQKLLAFGFHSNNIVRCYIGIDTDRFTPDPDVAREKIILCVGRIARFKGQEYLISAMSQLQDKRPEYHLVLVGDGDDDETLRLKEHAESLGVKVTFTGKQTQSQVLTWMRKAKVYVQPSVPLDSGREEALSLTIVESQAVGTPAVIFNTGGMPEAISPDNSGLVVEQKNVEQLSQAVERLISDDELWQRFSRNARAFAVETHNLHKQCAELEGIYDKAISEFNDQAG